jgi:hypothetical protein
VGLRNTCTHHSHKLDPHRGLVDCARCGCRATNQVRLMGNPCSPPGMNGAPRNGSMARVAAMSHSAFRFLNLRVLPRCTTTSSVIDAGPVTTFKTQKHYDVKTTVRRRPWTATNACLLVESFTSFTRHVFVTTWRCTLPESTNLLCQLLGGAPRDFLFYYENTLFFDLWPY